MTLFRTVGLKLALATTLSFFAAGEWAAPAQAAKPSYKDAMAGCRAQYGKKVINAIVHENGSVTCQWQVVREMTRKEAYDACRKKFGATTAFVQKKKGGWWCRYKPRY